jgi:UDP-glucose:(heptosyl)LPS alpha-1,3-glucosyltransferase
LRSIVVTSGSLLSQTIETYPACHASIQVIPPGVDRVLGPADADQKSLARQRLGLPLNGRCVLMVGNDYQKKGLPTLLDAMRQLPTNCYLAVVGNPSQIPQFRALTKVLELKNRVFFLGSRKEMNDVYSAADCLAHPTLEDTFAMVVLEAMAHGLPVVVSDEKYCGISGLLVHEVDALLLDDPTISDTLANSIKRLLEDRPLHERLVKNGMFFANNHRWKEVSEGYNEIYNAIANQMRKCR